MFNRLLQQQLIQHFGDKKNISPEWYPLLDVVSNSYDQFEKNSSVLERKMELNSFELTELNKKLCAETEENKLVFIKLHESLVTLRDEENDSAENFDTGNQKLLNIAELLKSESSKRKDAECKLKEYLRDLEKINKELDQFTYVVSHDLKAPLRAISSLTTFLEEDLLGTLNDEAKENFHILKGRVSRMENFINGLLEFSKATKATNLEMVDTRKVVDEIIDWLAIPQHIKIEISGNFPVLKAEKIKFEQVLANLISNAIKYNDKKEGMIEISCTDFEDWSQFYIKDNGPGIDTQYHQKIFELFQTLESRDNFESTGIGLAIVKKVVDEAGGKIWVESAIGTGSKFIFTYPKIDVNKQLINS